MQNVPVLSSARSIWFVGKVFGLKDEEVLSLRKWWGEYHRCGTRAASGRPFAPLAGRSFDPPRVTRIEVSHPNTGMLLTVDS